MVTTDQHNVPGRVLQPAGTPRSYIVETPSGDIQRNCSQLNIVPEPFATPDVIPDVTPDVIPEVIPDVIPDASESQTHAPLPYKWNPRE